MPRVKRDPKLENRQALSDAMRELYAMFTKLDALTTKVADDSATVQVRVQKECDEEMERKLEALRAENASLKARVGKLEWLERIVKDARKTRRAEK